MAGLALLGSAFLAQAVAAPNSDPEPPRCQGRAATIVGTKGDDTLRGTPGPDVIWAGRGDDVVHGLGGNDRVCGGRGDDVVYGERGNDRIFGGPGEDRLHGGHGDDLMLGGGGDDFIHGGLGIDVLRGGPGSDTADGSYGWDVLDGGRGEDTVSFASAVRSNHKGGGVRVSLRTGRATGDGRDRLRRFENVVGSAFDDVLIGDRRANRLYGGPGEDTLIGGGGRDMLIGGAGSDRCRGAPAARRRSCGRRREPRTPVHVHFDTNVPDPRAAGIVIAAGGGGDDISLAFDARARLLSITAGSGIAIHNGCTRPGKALNEAACPLGEAPRWVTVDLGAGDDRFRGADRLYGGGGDDFIDARDGGRDTHIQCGGRGGRRGMAFIDRSDPAPRNCGRVQVGKPIPGLPK